MDQNQAAPDAGQIYARNSMYSIPHALTSLNPSDERNFQGWVAANKIPFDPSPRADYDMRGFYRALTSGDPRAVQAVNPNDHQMHFPDFWKTPYHQSFSAESQWAKPGAPSWNEKDQLVLPNGQIVFDERAQAHRADGGDVSQFEHGTASQPPQDLGAFLAHIGDIPTQQQPDIPTIEPQPLWPKSLTPNFSGEAPSDQPVEHGYVARPQAGVEPNPLKDPQMDEALPDLVRAGVGRGAGALLTKVNPEAVALGSKALPWLGVPAVAYQIYDMARKLREPLTQAWNNGVIPSAEREQAVYEDSRRQTQKNFEQHPQETVDEVKSFLQWQPDTPGGRVNKSEYLKSVPYSVLNRAYADLYRMPSDNAPNTTTRPKTAAITSGPSPAGLE